MNKICYIVTVPSTIKAFFIPQLSYLAEHGYEVTVVCNYDPDMEALLGEKINYCPISVPRTVSIKRLISTTIKLRRLFLEHRYDIVQYSTLGASVSGSIAAILAGIKIRNYHVMGFRFVDFKGIKRRLHRFMEIVPCLLSTDIECVSKSNLQMAIDEKMFDADKGTVVFNGSSGGIDLGRFCYSKREAYRAEIRKKYGISPEDYVFGFVGRICKDKGIDEILTAFNRISEKESGYKLMLIGNVEEANNVNPEMYAESLVNESIIYTGSVNDVEKYYCAIDVLLLPTYHEGFGNVIIEAAAMGTPAIVSEIPGPIDASKEDVTALWIKPHSSEELYQAMCAIRGKEAAMGAESVAFATNNFNQDVLNRHILERKEHLLDKHRLA